MDPRGARRRRVGARELDQRGGARGVVVRARPGAGVVAVRHDDDRLLRAARPSTATRFTKRTRPRPGIVAGERAPCRTVIPYGCELVAEPAGGAVAPGVPGSAVRAVDARSSASARPLRPVEGGRQVRRLERGRPRDAEGEQTSSGRPTSSQRAAIEPAVDGPLERAAPRAAPLRWQAGRLPRRSIVGRGIGRHPRFHVKTPSHDSATILLVDDEEAVQKLLTYPLERDGFRVAARARRRGGAAPLRGGAASTSSCST